MINIAYLRKFWDLSFCLAKTWFKIKNEGSYLGVFWYVLGPILLFILLLIIFSNSLGEKIENYPLYLLLGIILYNFFQSTTSETATLIRESRDLIKSSKVIKESLIAGSVLKNLYSHIFEIIIFVALMTILQSGNIFNIIFYPIFLIFFALFIFGISLIIGSVSVYFNDTENIWAFILRLFLFGTPIFYIIEEGSILALINSLNPLYYFINICRIIIIYNKVPPWQEITIAIFFSFLFLGLGFFVFNKLKNRFAEVI